MQASMESDMQLFIYVACYKDQHTSADILILRSNTDILTFVIINLYSLLYSVPFQSISNSCNIIRDLLN